MSSPITTATSAATATLTTSSGIATVLQWIPDDIGKLATLVGLVLSAVLIRYHVNKTRIDTRDELARRQAEAIQREKDEAQLEQMRLELVHARLRLEQVERVTV
jgi:N-acyl-L-homoserine lactone synthetase